MGVVLCGAVVAALGVVDLGLRVAPAQWTLLAAIVGFAAALALLEGRRVRALSFNLFAVALAVRVFALIACTALSLRAGGPSLGPDSTTYFEGASELVRRGFHLDTIPLLFFGSYDVAHYYVFAALLRGGADLFSLQLFNCGCTALAAQVCFAIARLTVPRGATAVGLLVAVSPSLTVFSAVDLLKDPSVLLGTLIAIWAILRMARAKRARALAVPAVAGGVAFLYIRMARFYSFGYVEAATAGAIVWLALRTHRTGFRLRSGLVVLVVLFAVAEALPMREGWPTTPRLFAAQVGYVLETPGMLGARAALFARFRHGRSPRTLAELPADLVRQTLGPFPWILPPQWNYRTLREGDYFLFPGMLVWYAVLPFLLIGAFVRGATIVRGKHLQLGATVIWIFTVLYFLQYLAINVSYRQRDVMLPFVLIFACWGIAHACDRWQSWRWYGVYWACLAAFAVTHITVRAMMHR